MVEMYQGRGEERQTLGVENLGGLAGLVSGQGSIKQGRWAKRSIGTDRPGPEMVLGVVIG